MRKWFDTEDCKANACFPQDEPNGASHAFSVLILNVSGQTELSCIRLNVLLSDVLGQTYDFRIILGRAI